jgi:hypothetical protein
MPHFTGIYKDYELAHSIRLTTGENPEIRIQKIWTILERLRANRCVLSNYLQGMLLLKAIPKEWDTVAQLYCNDMQMANVTFDGVWDAIMAEFEWTARPVLRFLPSFLLYIYFFLISALHYLISLISGT